MAKSQSNILAVIPARGGSKGLKDKNLLPCHGQPLIDWAIDIALYMDFVPIVTTDSIAIASYAEERDIAVKQTSGDYLHSDDCKSLDVWLDAWDKEMYLKSVLLEPTCPTRLPEDIERCLAMSDRFSSVLTVSPSTPKEKLMLIEDGKAKIAGHLPRRQDCDQWYEANGACYVMRADHKGEIIQNAGAVIIDSPRISIDTAYDLWLSEVILSSS